MIKTKEKIKNYIKKNNYIKACPEIIDAIKNDIKNIQLLDCLEKEFKKQKLYNELIEIYRLNFQYTLKPKYFEKIGDLYFKIGEYKSALEYYFNYAENSKPCARIYKKLAKSFEKEGDLESMNACLEQVQILGGKS